MKTKAKTSRWAKLAKIMRPTLLSAALLTTLACVLIPVNTHAEEVETWGPQDRATFTWQKPADYVTFNSITDNPLLGDERNFVRIRKAGTQDVATDNITLEVGQEYEVSVWFHNNAQTRLNKEPGNPGVAKNVRLLLNMPERVGANASAVIEATISADNANPKSVWDMAFGNTTSAVALRYVPNSATVYLNDPGEYDAERDGYFRDGFETANGKTLNTDALFGKDGYGGSMIGYWNDQWGTLPGCSEYSGYVQFRFKVDQPNFEMYKTVSAEGANDYHGIITAKPGDILDFKIEYKNTGTTYQDNVIAKDTLPDGLVYIPGTTYFESSDVERKLIDDGYLFGNGVNMNDFAPGDTATVTYQAQLSDDPDIFPCGDTEIYNEGVIGTQNGTGTDKTKITVSRECTCATNPEMEGCQELPSTGPVEVAIATLIIGGIGGAGYYLYSTRRALKTVKSGIVGGNSSSAASDLHHRGEAHHHVEHNVEAKGEQHTNKKD